AINEGIKSGGFSGAVDLLEKAPTKLPDYEKENLQKKLRAAFLSYIDSLAERRSFPRALAELDDAPSGVGLTAEDRQKAQDKIRAAWLGQAQDEFQNDPQSARPMETATALLRRFAGDRDAQLLIARCQVRQGNNAAAQTTLTALGKTAGLPPEYQPLDAGLLL